MMQLLSTAGYQAPAPPCQVIPRLLAQVLIWRESLELILLHFRPFAPDVRCRKITAPANLAYCYNLHFLTGSTFRV